jgi:hypothetical protein
MRTVSFSKKVPRIRCDFYAEIGQKKDICAIRKALEQGLINGLSALGHNINRSRQKCCAATKRVYDQNTSN